MNKNKQKIGFKLQQIQHSFTAIKFRASLKTLIGALLKSGLAAYTRISLVNPLVIR
jgi:hypothetical protein